MRVWMRAQSCPTLCDSIDYSLPGSSVRGIFQTRILEWVAISFSRGSSWGKDWTHVFYVSLPLCHLGSPLCMKRTSLFFSSNLCFPTFFFFNLVGLGLNLKFAFLTSSHMTLVLLTHTSHFESHCGRELSRQVILALFTQ